jgi:hypothetical protein
MHVPYEYTARIEDQHSTKLLDLDPIPPPFGIWIRLLIKTLQLHHIFSRKIFFKHHNAPKKTLGFKLTIFNNQRQFYNYFMIFSFLGLEVRIRFQLLLKMLGGSRIYSKSSDHEKQVRSERWQMIDIGLGTW